MHRGSVRHFYYAISVTRNFKVTSEKRGISQPAKRQLQDVLLIQERPFTKTHIACLEFLS